MSKKIITDKIEIYSTLVSFQFVESQRLYFCKDVIMIDITTFNRIELEDLLMVVYTDHNVAILSHFAQDYISQHKPVLFSRIEKVSNKRERHEICGSNAWLLLDGDEYKINKIFARAQLNKIVPERIIIDY